MKKNWNERSKLEKILGISRQLVSLAVICVSIMKFQNFWPKALYLAIPLFAVQYLLETIYYWKRNKDMAAFSLFMAIIIVAVSCAVFFI